MAVKNAIASNWSLQTRADERKYSREDVTAPSAPSITATVSVSTPNSAIDLVVTPGVDLNSTVISHKIYRSTTLNGTYTLLTVIDGTTHTDTGLSGSTTYHYKATSANAFLLESSLSSASNASTTGSGGGGGDPILSDGFEDGTVNAWTESASQGASFEIPTGGAASGTRYLVSTLTYASGGNTFRSEHSLKNSQTSASQGIPYYYGVSIKMPSDVPTDTAHGETIAQWHPLDGTHWAINNLNGNWRWVAHNFPAGGNSNMGAVVKGVWHRWIIRAVWSNSNTGGSFKLWLNPSSESSPAVHNPTGIRTLASTFETLMKVKIGIYKPNWKTQAPAGGVSPRVYYHDDYRIGLTFADVI